MSLPPDKRTIDPPVEDVESPALRLTEPPTPEDDTPTLIPIEPLTPFAAPVESAIPPLSASFESPDFTLTEPELSCELGVDTATEPDAVDPLVPLEIVTEPPVSVVLDPACKDISPAAF